MQRILLGVYCVTLAISCRQKYVNAELFSDNVLIGNALLDSSTVFAEEEPYNIYLLHEAGFFGNYPLSDGYLLGFQWTTDAIDVNTLVNFQVYSGAGALDGLGSYQLITETGAITIADTTNVYYFPEGFGMTAVTYSNYFLAVVQYGDYLPVHTQSCTSGGRVLASTDPLPSVGGTVHFDTVYSDCLVLSLQAMFLPSYFAGDCTLQVIQEDMEEEWSYSLVRPTSANDRCWILRAAREDLRIELETDEFNVPCNPGGFTLIGYSTGFAESGTAETLCGSIDDVFKTWQSDAPYVHGLVFSTSLVTSVSFRFRVRNAEVVDDQEGGLPGWAIALIVICLVGFAGFFWCWLSKKKKEGEERKRREEEAKKKAEQDQREKAERERKEKEQKDKEERERKAKSQRKIQPGGASAPPDEGSSSSQRLSAPAAGELAGTATRSNQLSQRRSDNANPATVITVEPMGHRLTPIHSALPTEPPPSYDTVITADRQQGITHGASLANAPHGLNSTDLYGVPAPAQYQEP